MEGGSERSFASSLSLAHSPYISGEMKQVGENVILMFVFDVVKQKQHSWTNVGLGLCREVGYFMVQSLKKWFWRQGPLSIGFLWDALPFVVACENVLDLSFFSRSCPISHVLGGFCEGRTLSVNDGWFSSNRAPGITLGTSPPMKRNSDYSEQHSGKHRRQYS